MTPKTILPGTVHKLPADFKQAISASSKVLALWQDITPLARNEWICWITFVKKNETRAEHIKRTINDLKRGKRRPCCWIGCIHRKDKEVSPSVKEILKKQSF
jgi:hypothetical protein